METIKIKHPKVEGNDSGYCIINKSDYDPDTHELYEAEKKDVGKNKK